MRSNINEWLVWHYRFRQLYFGFLINISWITWKQTQTHPVGENTTNIEGHCSSFSPTKNLFPITFIWQKTVNIRAEIETSARPLPIKCPVAQKYISDLFGMPCRMLMEERMTFWKTCNACMKWKVSKQDNQRNSVAEKCQSSSKEGQPTQVSLKRESVPADEHRRENYKEKNQKLT